MEIGRGALDNLCRVQRQKVGIFVIYLNGEALSGFEGATVAELLEKKSYKSAFVAAELNGEIVVKKDYSAAVLKDGDKLEVVSFVGGG